MRFAFMVKLICKDNFFTMMALPAFITLKPNPQDKLDVNVSNEAPKDFILKFFIAKTERELTQGNFFSVSLKDTQVCLAKHIGYDEELQYTLDESCNVVKRKDDILLSKELVETLQSLFEVRQ